MGCGVSRDGTTVRCTARYCRSGSSGTDLTFMKGAMILDTCKPQWFANIHDEPARQIWSRRERQLAWFLSDHFRCVRNPRSNDPRLAPTAWRGPNCGDESTWRSSGMQHPGTALDYLLGTYVRDKDALNASINLLQDAGGVSLYDQPGIIATIRGDFNVVKDLLDREPSPSRKRYPLLEHRYDCWSYAHSQRCNPATCCC